MMTIEQMKVADLDQVCEIEAVSFSIPWSYQGFYDSMMREDTIYLVAKEAGKVIGYCGAWIVCGEVQINNIAVLEESRGMGVGKAILKALFLEGEKRNTDSYTLEVRISNQAAISLYEGMGFLSQGVRPGFYDDPKEDALVMTAIPYGNGEVSLL
ncbi:MAG: [ribosomal protein S18]-alanine N-acetyltransferase [Clostridiales bacterium]|nr:[ribosomal protein S18]-alanine N-acetyltransferase [Clostridiales bacterium]